MWVGEILYGLFSSLGVSCYARMETILEHYHERKPKLGHQEKNIPILCYAWMETILEHYHNR